MVRVIGLAIGSLFLLGCGEPKLVSRWVDREIKVDGNHLEWEGAVYSVEDLDGSIGLFNDDSNLYICLATTDQDLMRQVLGQGLTIWFDPEGGKEEGFGIRFPLGMRERGLGGERREGGMLGREMMERPDPSAMRASLEESEPELEIVRGEEATRMFVAQAAGIDLKIDETNGAFVYELVVPLDAGDSRPFAIRAAPGQTIGVGFKTPEMERPSMGRGGQGGMPDGAMGGGRRGGGKGGGGRGGMMGGRSRPNMPTPLDVWLQVDLASPGRSAES